MCVQRIKKHFLGSRVISIIAFLPGSLHITFNLCSHEVIFESILPLHLPSFPLSNNSLSRTELCNFSGYKIYPGHGKLTVRSDNKSFRFSNGKCESHFLSKKKPTKFLWTVLSRRVHKKGTSEEVAKKRSRKVAKVQRAVVGASWEDILAKRNQTEAVRKATRDSAVEAAKNKKKEEQAKKRAEKVKALGAAQRGQAKFKAPQQAKPAKAQGRY
jgi:large subunit ribosomal protein L24e